MKRIYMFPTMLLSIVILALGGCADQPDVQPVEPTPAYGPTYTTPATASCYDCATVTAIQPIPEGSGGDTAGAVVGAIIGAAVGHQFGAGTGQTAATVGGAAAGAYVGSQYNDGDEYDYRVTVQRDNGATESFVVDDPPAYGVGTRVRLNSD